MRNAILLLASLTFALASNAAPKFIADNFGESPLVLEGSLFHQYPSHDAIKFTPSVKLVNYPTKVEKEYEVLEFGDYSDSEVKSDLGFMVVWDKATGEARTAYRSWDATSPQVSLGDKVKVTDDSIVVKTYNAEYKLKINEKKQTMKISKKYKKCMISLGHIGCVDSPFKTTDSAVIDYKTGRVIKK